MKIYQVYRISYPPSLQNATTTGEDLHAVKLADAASIATTDIHKTLIEGDWNTDDNGCFPILCKTSSTSPEIGLTLIEQRLTDALNHH
jgi:hypothetical protein